MHTEVKEYTRALMPLHLISNTKPTKGGVLQRLLLPRRLRTPSQRPTPAFCCVLRVFCTLRCYEASVQLNMGQAAIDTHQCKALHATWNRELGEETGATQSLPKGWLCRMDYFISPTKRAGTEREAGLSISPATNHLSPAAGSCCAGSPPSRPACLNSADTT